MTWRRHQLIRLIPDAWPRLLAAETDPARRACLLLWSRRDFPLVVTRQEPGARAVAVGLAAPLGLGRLRLALQVEAGWVRERGEFPPAQRAVGLLPRRLRRRWLALCAALAAQGVAARIYGSFGWQLLTGEHCVHEASDLDLALPMADHAAADAACALLAQAAFGATRVDGELQLPDGGGVAWREWQAWRRGAVAQVLVKRLHGVALEVPSALPTGGVEPD